MVIQGNKIRFVGLAGIAVMCTGTIALAADSMAQVAGLGLGGAGVVAVAAGAALFAGRHRHTRPMVVATPRGFNATDAYSYPSGDEC